MIVDLTDFDGSAPDPGDVDGAGFGRALVRLGADLIRHPWRALPAAAEFTATVAAAGARTAALALGRPTEPAVAPAPRDRRFADPAWQKNPFFFGTAQMYLAWSRLLRDVADKSDLEPPVAQKAEFAVGALIDALAPTNFLWTNPAALRKAFETRGASVAEGLHNFWEDVS